MKKLIFPLILLSFLFSSCTDSKNTDKNQSQEQTIKGDRVYGGTLRVNENAPYLSLYPHSITDLVSSHVASQIYEGLVKLNPRDLSVVASLAGNWDIDTSGTIYTFFLKKGVHFQNDPCFPGGKGPELKAKDVKYSFELLCTQSQYNYSFAATFKDRVLGAAKYYEASANGAPAFGLEGIKIIDDYTVQVILEKPSTSFIYILTQPVAAIIAKEAVDHYGNMLKIGTGPFVYAKNESPEEKAVLVRNEFYHAADSLGNQLPYLDSVIFTFIDTKKAELVAFQNGALDILIGLPAESIKEVVENKISDFQKQPPKYILDRLPEMETQYYEFNTVSSVFKEKKIRQAFSYAIDRERILNDVLKGEGYGPGIHGISPPSFKGYDISKIAGYSHDAVKAKKLLAEAGYPNGKNFPTIKLELNSGGSKHIVVGLEIARQLRSILNVNIELEIVPFAVKLENAKYGRGDIFRTGWVADYPSPENFLAVLYGKSVPKAADAPSFPNVPRYTSAEYDRLFELGVNAKSIQEGYDYFLQAENVMIEDAPVMVLWYDEKYRVYQSNIKNYYSNPMNYWDFSEVFKAPATEKKEEAKK